MRNFLLSVFWITNVGGVFQIVVIAVSVWIIASGAHSISELSLNVFIVEYASWLVWMKSLLIVFLGDLARWILTIPVLVIAPARLVSGTIIGLWAYSVAKRMPHQVAYS